MDTAKDKVALHELEQAIDRLNGLALQGNLRLGKEQPVISGYEISIVKDHLDLAVRYAQIG